MRTFKSREDTRQEKIDTCQDLKGTNLKSIARKGHLEAFYRETIVL